MRYLLVDGFSELRPGRFARAYRNVTLTEDVFATHFPNFPILPGVLITDTMAQVAAWAAASENGLDVVAGLVALREAKFRRYVRPGDQMVVETELVRHLGERTVWKAKALVDNKVIASIKELEFILTSLSPEAARLERQRFIYCGGDEKLLSNAVPA